ncbi:hypothetical protein [Paenibacillus sp. GCM10027626]|uniref:hypothetical protein n=1 Tax=Paenibacillus sp. GCM10027626 TaxID=3273411 RepID=UPI00363ACD3F
MTYTSKAAARTASLLILAIVLTGCQQAMNINSQKLSTKPLQGQHSERSQDEPVAGNPDDTITAKNKEQTDAVAESSSDKKPKGKASSSWNTDSPALHNVALGSSRNAAAITQLGKPDDTYSLGKGQDFMEVQEYNGFSIGIGKDDSVVYIEIYDEQVSTGLTGLVIGGTKESAVKALGKPSTNTSSVLTYTAGDAVLKLDLDPVKSTVVSAKLFYKA